MKLSLSQGLIPMLAVVGSVVAAAAATPSIGEKATDFQLESVRGGTVHLSELTVRGPVALIVLRGYPGYQCPFCNRQVQDFIAKAHGFAASGTRVVLVYPGPSQDLAKRASEFMTDKTLPDNFDLLLDPGYEFTNRYGLRWDALQETAYPSTFLIDRQGIIFYSKMVKLHAGRTTAAEILELLAGER